MTTTLELTPDELDFHAAEIADRGYAVIPDALTGHALDAARLALDNIFERETDIASRRKWKNDRYQVSYMLPLKDPLFLALPFNPRVLPLMRRLVGRRCTLGSLNGLSMTPGGNTQALHLDAPESTPGYILFINAMYCLDDFTADNGSTRVVPASQHQVFDYREDMSAHEAGAVRIEAPAGSVIAFDGGLIHAGSANTTDRPRRALYAYYGRHWAKPQWDFLRSFPPETLTSLTDEERALYGIFGHPHRYDIAENRRINPGKPTW